ncbi:MerR family transcriptional regulator [Paenibacillus harenae]|uniref:MerR family transcriptional regulator n=1 Tax=Paenibacillus harenae TaxID=306543 RepID=UPI00278EF0C2|nr:MerR family transcriptional regulator [Paenibacillus harenae]MDQ0062949.1 DNA-binding transcriptional MerR regulator [Paenibacillus harenae]
MMKLIIEKKGVRDLKISKIAKLTGISARSVRYYEQKGLLTVSRHDNNYREFDDSIVELINTIQLYLGLGLTTDQIKDVLYCKHSENSGNGLHDKKDEYCEELMQVYETKRNEVIRQRLALEEAQIRLEKQINVMRENRDKWV